MTWFAYGDFYNANIGMAANNTIKIRFKKNIETKDKYNKNEDYEIKCDCNATYIG